MRVANQHSSPDQPRSTALYEAILRLNDLEECIRFFDDLCAVTELRTLEQRYDVAGCLVQGKVYSEIRRETGASSATVSRVNRRQHCRQRALRSGTSGPRLCRAGPRPARRIKEVPDHERTYS